MTSTETLAIQLYEALDTYVERQPWERADDKRKLAMRVYSQVAHDYFEVRVIKATALGALIATVVTTVVIGLALLVAWGAW